MNVLIEVFSEDGVCRTGADRIERILPGSLVVGDAEYRIVGNDIVLHVTPVAVPADGEIEVPDYDGNDLMAFHHRRIVRLPNRVRLKFAGGKFVGHEPVQASG